MKNFFSKAECYIPVKHKNGNYYTIKFEETTGGIYQYTPKSQEEDDAITSFIMGGNIWSEETVDVEPEYQPHTKDGIKKHETRKAEKANKEIVDSVESCSDARSFLKERFKDEDVALRSKKEILDYADSKNIFFPNL